MFMMASTQHRDTSRRLLDDEITYHTEIKINLKVIIKVSLNLGGGRLPSTVGHKSQFKS